MPDESPPTMRYLVIQQEYQKLVKKFNTVSDSIAFSFKAVDEEANPMQWLEVIFKYIFYIFLFIMLRVKFETEMARQICSAYFLLRKHS